MELAGYTERVATLVTVLEDCAHGKYQRKIASAATAMNAGHASTPSRRRQISSVSLNTKTKCQPTTCLEFDKHGMPLIKGLVAQSVDGSIILENVS